MSTLQSDDIWLDRTRLSLALDAGRMGTWEWDIQGNRVSWSAEEERLYGLEPGTFDGTVEAYAALVHPDDRASSIERVQAAMAQRAAEHSILHRIVRPNGETRWLDSHARFVYDTDGTPLRLVGVSTDVTERILYLRTRDRQDEMLGAVDVGLWYCDLPFSELQWDARVKRHFWLPPDARVTIETFFERIHPDDRDRTRAAIEESIARHSPYDIEYRTVAADDSPEAGAVRWVRAIGYTAYNGAGEPIRFDGVTVDVSERHRIEADLRRTETALRMREAEFRTLANSIPQLAWMARPDGALYWYNQRWFDYTGTTLDEMEGWGWQRVHHPDHVGRVTERFQQAVAAGSEWEDTFPLRGADGQYRWFLSRAVPMRGENGDVVRWFGTNTDITALRDAERARDAALASVQYERARLNEILEQAPAAISVTEGPEHVGVLQNDVSRRLAGRDTIGRAAREVFPELAGQGVLEAIDRVYATGESFSGTEVPVQWDRDGDGHPEDGFFNIVYQAMRDPSGKVTGVITFAVEVTEQVHARQEIERKAEELARSSRALAESNRELDQFAYVASHDLKAPLRGIANLTQWIEEDLGERITGESLEHMRLLQGRVHRMEALIDGILEYSRAARVRNRPESVDTGALVRDVVDLVAAPVGVVHVADGMPTVTAERVPLQQVFINLIGNALKHGRADAPEVRVGWRDAGDAWEFSISDNGKGIPPEYHERIWGIFQTLEARDKVEGTGIGLAVVRKIVESRGGRAWVESEPGKGATFLFTVGK